MIPQQRVLQLLLSCFCWRIADALLLRTPTTRRRRHAVMRAAATTLNHHDNQLNDNDPLLQAIQIWGQQQQHSSTDATRIFHGRGGCFPGYEHVTLDWYPPVVLLTTFGAPQQQQQQQDEEQDDESSSRDNDFLIEKITDALLQAQQQRATINLVHQHRGGRRAATTSCTTRLVTGHVPDPHIVSEHNNCRYVVQLREGQNHGLFLDMAAGRAWVQQNGRRFRRVLNLFAYTCAFSIATLRGGAASVVNVDMSKTALQMGQRNHDLNGFGQDGRAKFFKLNVFKGWKKISQAGAPYDLIIVDPPSFQKGSFVAKQDYGKVVRRLPDLLSADGYVLLCLNAPELDEAFLHQIVHDEASALQWIQRLDNPPTFPAIDPDRALKVLLYQNLAVPAATAHVVEGKEERGKQRS